MVLEVPQEEEYDTSDDARDDIASFAESEGYAVTVGNRKMESYGMNATHNHDAAEDLLAYSSARISHASSPWNRCYINKQNVHHQKQAIVQKHEFERSRLLVKHRGPIWSDVMKNVSVFALNKREDFDQHWWIVQPTREPLSSTPQPTPTIDKSLHNIREAHANMGPHQKRLLKQTMASFNVEGIERISDPDIIRTGGRPSNAQNARASGSQNLYRRDPSAFERFELEAGMESQ
ncbi:hypothetical protein PsorP6_006096 [Peronosclerospora sorghi]|uniref:Uncharacterized protein n=1 Tax=Peronosclerospora sorghi TaxID=230839 RepID=A0ACC0W308_9STRA|nr:hypothetical protein PsorP6_006096 [Peronosclerospora sorghi]